MRAGCDHYIAGTDVVFPSGDSAALGTPLGFVNGLAVDGAGNLLIADWGNFVVLRLGRDGRIRTVAGSGIRFVSGDGDLATRAAFIQPYGVALDRQALSTSSIEQRATFAESRRTGLSTICSATTAVPRRAF